MKRNRSTMPALVFAVCLVLMPLNACASGLWNWLFGTGQKEEARMMTHQETVDALRALGIEVPDEAAAQTEQAIAGMIADLKKRHGISRNEQPWDFPLGLLTRLGIGNYDFKTGVWTPTSKDVYAFDGEVCDIEHMYSLYLQGISAIVPGFSAEDVSEEITEWEQPRHDAEDIARYGTAVEGVTKVSFTLHGRVCTKELAFLGDWFDTAAIDWINEVLEEEGFPGRIRAFHDGGQGLILLYGDDAFARQLEQVIPRPFRGIWE